MANTDEERGSSSRKRARLTSQDHVDDDEVDLEQEEEEEIPEVSIEPRIWDRDDAGFVEGSIIRIRMHNFLTYVDAEIRPGPDLNMLIGPNGNGKSAVACAIAIGLNFPVKVLGRAETLSSFVNNKTNLDEAWVEIELRGKKGQGNLTVRRTWGRTDNSAVWQLNGQHAIMKDVKEEMAKLNIQVNNLCNFLPQDKVASFAKMSPPELLTETQKSIGGRELVRLHDTLKTERKVQKGHEERVASKVESLRRKKEKQAQSEEEVRSFQERRQIKHRLDVLQLAMALSEYETMRHKHLTVKTRRNEIENEIKELEHANQPFMDSQAALQGIVQHYDDGKKILRDKQSELSKAAARAAKAVKEGNDKIEDLRAKLETVKEDERARQKAIDVAQRTLDQLQKRIDKKPAEPDFSEVNARLMELEAGRTEADNACRDRQDELHQIKAEADRFQHELTRASQRLNDLSNQERLREQACRRDAADLWTVVEWYRANKNLFKGRVYEPARLTLSAVHPSYAAIIETAAPKDGWRTFVFELDEDAQTFHRIVNDEKRLGATASGSVLPANFDRTSSFSPEQFRAWGFDKTVIDLIKGPEGMLQWLCAHYFLHENPVALRSDARIDAAAVEKSGVRMYFTPDSQCRFNRSKYGARLVQTQQNTLKFAQILRAGADPEELAARTEEVARIKTSLTDVQKRRQKLEEELAEIRVQLDEIEEEKKKVTAERVALNKPMQEWRKAFSALEPQKRTLKQAKSKPTADEKRKKLQASMSEINQERYQEVQKQTEIALRVSKLKANEIILGLRHLQAETDLRAMSESANEKDRELAEKQEELKTASEELKAAKDSAKRLLGAYNARRAEVSEEIRLEVDAYGQGDDSLPTFEELEAEKGQLEAQLLVTQEIDPSVLRSYERRADEISTLEKEVEASEAELAQSTALINEARNEWLPKLKALVSKISEKFGNAFERMGLQGEVGIEQHEDYERWGIQIRVSFRDGEEMQILNSHRQSGGERALTTVMYLMSLAELSQAPFTLVDEINQGMDSRVERQVHNQLVKLTCQDSVGQYFLLTPKLLTNLYYHPRMKVLIINKGYWMPPSENLLTLKRFIDKKVRKNRAEGIVTTARPAPALVPIVA